MTVENKKAKKREPTVTDFLEDAIEAVHQMDLVRLGKKQGSVDDLKTVALKKIQIYNNLVDIKGSLTIGKARATLADIYRVAKGKAAEKAEKAAKK